MEVRRRGHDVLEKLPNEKGDTKITKITLSCCHTFITDLVRVPTERQKFRDATVL